MQETNHTYALPCLPQATKYSSSVYTKLDNSDAGSISSLLLSQGAVNWTG
jgi:hypothetical protein